MTRPRFMMIAAAGGCAALGLTAGAVSLMSGMVDQAIALAWPGLGAAVLLALMMPGRRAE
ncbi:hypothetical protein DDZ18_13345 [Marinicauda salina]|uniref:Uncharacterized protein n=1 Tax=Marinicauda salina TaxID=2135793 RepID=A0A2U2BQW7_9PROT|nr:hypothetical protein [Marinicauda salina]PWE16401.1 hypothetical protein DDZ18_13345 [Marinicauda salina]